MKPEKFNIGIDIGSTTIKVVVLKRDNIPIFESYERHNGAYYATLLKQLELLTNIIGSNTVRLGITGSQGTEIAKILDAVFIQEVMAQAIAVGQLYPQTKTSIELGGQDAKMVFYSELSGSSVSDMRMNGVCAGGTGAFIDQIATLLGIPVEKFNETAEKGTKVYDISGRCGVFAKTDIQPLLNQGVRIEDIALSSLHALAKQTIGGLAQGMVIKPPVLLAGGPFYFIPQLGNVFKERLNFSDSDIIIPSHTQTFMAYGTALSLDTPLGNKSMEHKLNAIVNKIVSLTKEKKSYYDSIPFFTSEKEIKDFEERHRHKIIPTVLTPGEIEVYIGIDAGSTTTKIIVIDKSENVIFSYYSNNMGIPLETGKKALLAFLDFCNSNHIKPLIRGIGTTGYGEKLFATAFMADYHTVETIAHKEAAVKFCPDVNFVLDLGGQDMKAIFIKNGIITNIILNEACSAGCGSFLETYAKTLNIEPSQIASHAFASKSPSILGSRCTVFMNSSVITELKNGKNVDDILAGLCRSIVENIFTKVVRIANFDDLGEKIVVQGGTFKNDAVLRAFEKYIGKEVIRPPYCGEMGALGIALLCKKHIIEKKSKRDHILTREFLEKFTYSVKNDSRCDGCANYCSRHIVTFSHGGSFVTGNRCEKGLKDVEGAQRESTIKKAEDLLYERYLLTFKNINHPSHFEPEKTIGIPRCLEFFDSFPFWNEFFKSLGFTVVLSDESSYKLFESGLSTIPSDTVCLPAKIVHGHINSLVSKGVKTIFMPIMLKNIKENENQDDSWFCAVLQGYPEIIRLNGCIPAEKGIRFLTPSFKFADKVVRERQIIEFAQKNFNLSLLKIVKSIKEADKELEIYREKLLTKGKKILDELKKEDRFGVVIACRPYHNDPFVNHRVSKFFTKLGIPVLVNESLPYLDKLDFSFSRIDTINTFHNRMLGAAKFVAEHPNLEMVQIVSFGCGHDAVLTDEIARILRVYGGKELLTLKVDEGENEGPLNIRITSFVETIKAKRLREKERFKYTKNILPFEIKFKKEDKLKKIVLVPNLSWSFSLVISRAMKNQGYFTQILPVAGKEAIALGKRYVNNDICYPAQLNIGEILYYLKSNPDKVSISAGGLAKNCNDCRACHYAALARKALDDAGFVEVPLVTTSFEDRRKLHPGFKLNQLSFSIDMVRGITLIDALDEMARICRPYELNKGDTDAVHHEYTISVIEALGESWKKALDRFDKAVDAFNNLRIDRNSRKPRVGIIGEILVNFHETGNYGIVRYLEEHGMEVVLPNLIEFWRQDVVNYEIASKYKHVRFPLLTKLWGKIYEGVFDNVINEVEKRKKKFFRYKPHPNIKEIAEKASKVMNISFRTGEGWLIPGEIVNWIEEEIELFIIVQPFGCLPNHISGKGIVKAIRNLYPYVKIITLDFDPDTSLANIHNRLQMLIVGSEKKKMREEAVEVVN